MGSLKSVRLLLLMIAISCAGGPSGYGDRGADLAFTDVNVVDVANGRVHSEQTVLVAGNRIQAVGRSARERIPVSAHVINARGQYIIPGLIDTHVHLGWDLDSASTRALLAHFPAAGVTTVREASSRSTVPQQVAVRTAISAGRVVGPRLVVAGRIDARATSRARVSGPVALAQLWASYGVNGLKLRSGLTKTEVIAVIAEGRRLGLPVFGHTADGTLSYAAVAIRAGLAGVTHVEPIAQDLPLEASATPDTASAPGDEAGEWWRSYVRWTLVDSVAEEALASLIVRSGVWLEPTLAISAQLAFPDRWRNDPQIVQLPAAYVRDIMDTTRLPMFRGDSLLRAQAAYERMTRFVRRVHNLGGVVVTGTDNSPMPAWGIHDELALLVEAGIAPAAALRAATLDAAWAVGLSGQTGMIARGLAADLVLLDGNPLDDIRNTRSVAAVVVDGRYFDRPALRKLVSLAEPH